MGFYKQCVIYIDEVISEVKAHFRGLINFEIKGETLVIYYDYKSILTGSIMYANIYDRSGVRYWKTGAERQIRYSRYRIRYWEAIGIKSNEFLGKLYGLLANQKN